MVVRRNDNQPVMQTENALRTITRELREIMAQAGDGQTRLDMIVRQISSLMGAEVCSIYFKRQDGTLELFASEGLNAEAVHNTRLNRGEGLVGLAAETANPVNEPEAQQHPAFSFRPETGEEAYHSMLAVPMLRGGVVLGVIAIQNQMRREYSEEDAEVLQTTAMVVAEHLVSGDVTRATVYGEINRSSAVALNGSAISDGIALGHVVLHEPRVVVTTLLSEDTEFEALRLDRAIADLRTSIDDMLAHETVSHAGAHRDVLETYRLFANDKGWQRRMQDTVREGLTAEAAVERVQNGTRVRMLNQNDPFWRERLRDLDDLAGRLLRILAGRKTAVLENLNLPNDTILVARNMGPAELLDYDTARLRGMVVEEAGAQSHVAIVARALGIAGVGEIPDIVERVTSADAIIVDGESGQVHIRPSPNIIEAYNDKVRFRARRQEQYRALRDKKAITKDGTEICLLINAGLMADMAHLRDSGAEGIGLFRTELQFMIVSTFPRLGKQIETYRKILEGADNKPVVFRALDIGGDKALPYLRQPKEDNPAIGWRAIRLALDRPALFRLQVRAMFRAAASRELRLMLPMVSAAYEIDQARELIASEEQRAFKRRDPMPAKFKIGAMVEVPSILLELDALMARVDFVSVGSNDLLQFLYAADRSNPLVAERYDPLSISALQALRMVQEAGERNNVPVTLCGEFAAKPLQAMALIGLGYRALSMAPAAIGPVKKMILSLDRARISAFMNERLKSGCAGDLRQDLKEFAARYYVEI